MTDAWMPGEALFRMLELILLSKEDGHEMVMIRKGFTERRRRKEMGVERTKEGGMAKEGLRGNGTNINRGRRVAGP